MSASRTEYGTRSFSASEVPLASPETSVFNNSWASESGCSPVSSMEVGGGGGATARVDKGRDSARATGVISRTPRLAPVQVRCGGRPRCPMRRAHRHEVQALRLFRDAEDECA